MARHIWSRNIWQAKKFDVLPKSFHGRYSMSSRNKIWINPKDQKGVATKVLKPEKQESSKNSSWELCLQCNAWWNPRDGEANFGFQLYTISSSSALHIAQYMYFSFFNFMLVAPASSWKVWKCPALTKRCAPRSCFYICRPWPAQKDSAPDLEFF